MADEMEGMEEDNTFDVEAVERCAFETAEEILKDVGWDEIQVPLWINQICEDTTRKLIALNRPYKFVVTCVMQ